MMGLLSPWAESGWTAYAAPVILLVGLFVWRVHMWYRLRHIPGPRLAGWSVLWQLRGALQDNYHEILKEATDKYGKLPFPVYQASV